MTDEQRVRRWALGVAVAWGLGAGLFVALATPCLRMFREVGLLLPDSTECAFTLLETLRHPLAYVVLAALVLVLLLPVDAGGSADRVVRWLRLGALQSLCLWGAGLAAIVHGVIDVRSPRTWCVCHRTLGHPGDGRLLLILPLLAVGLVQLHTWVRLSGELLRVPRGAPGLELRRAAFLALPVGALAAVAAIELVEAMHLGSATLLVPPALAASWTALFAAIGGALLLRHRATREA